MVLGAGSTAANEIKASALRELIFQWEKSDKQTHTFQNVVSAVLKDKAG